MAKGFNISVVSQKKKDNDTVHPINPLPIPLVRTPKDQQPVWPTSQSGYHVHFKGRLDTNRRCIIIEDTSSMYMLSRMGSFGTCRNSLIPFSGHQSKANPQLDHTNESCNEEDEHLVLDLCEAYFLSYALGCLIVIDDDDDNDNVDGRILNLDDLWMKFSKCYDTRDISRFAIRYSVYHYFRSEGWIVKSGVQYGTTFLLYKEGPTCYHSLYAVQVFGLDEDFKLRSESESSISYNWQSLLTTHRVIQSASKELLIAYVILPKVYKTDDTSSSPKCIESFQIKTQLFSRWSPNMALTGNAKKC